MSFLPPFRFPVSSFVFFLALPVSFSSSSVFPGSCDSPAFAVEFFRFLSFSTAHFSRLIPDSHDSYCCDDLLRQARSSRRHRNHPFSEASISSLVRPTRAAHERTRHSRPKQRVVKPVRPRQKKLSRFISRAKLGRQRVQTEPFLFRTLLGGSVVYPLTQIRLPPGGAAPH